MTNISARSLPVNYYAEIRSHGLKLKRKGVAPMKQSPPKRGVVKTLSVASGGRLWDALTKVDASLGLPFFVTLTYPADWPGDWVIWKKHLDNFRRSLFRDFQMAHQPAADEGGPECGRVFVGGVWRLEAQRRGAPHFHILLWSRMTWGPDDLKDFRKWVAEVWYRIVGSGDTRHLKAGTGVDQATEQGDANAKMGYLCKYLGKDSVHPDSQVFKNPVGRYWGVWNKADLHKPPFEIQLSKDDFCKLRRVVYKRRESRDRLKRTSSKPGSRRYKRRESFNRKPVMQLKCPGVKEFMSESEGLRLIEYVDPLPF